MKLQTISLAAKLGVITSSTYQYHEFIIKLVTYLFSLARRDKSIEVRDRTRFLEALLIGAGVIEPPQKKERASWDDSSDPHNGGDDVVEGDERRGGSMGGVKLRKEQVRVVLLEGVRSVPLKAEGAPSFLVPH